MPEDSRDGNGVSTGLAKDDDASEPWHNISPGLLSDTVGLPRRFGNPVDSSQEFSGFQETRAAATELSLLKTNSHLSLREMLRKVTVNEAALYTAIERLGGGEKGMKAVIEYIMSFQLLKEQNAGSLKPDSFARGLEQLCLLKGQQSQEEGPNLATVHQGTRSAAPHQGSFDQTSSGAFHASSQQTIPSWHPQGPEEWYQTGHFVDRCRMGYMESPPLVGAFFPNFFCPYPPTFAGFAPFNPCMQPVFFPVMACPNVNPTSSDSVQAAAIIRASRKSRIARHRGQVNGQQQTHPTPPAAAHVGCGPLANGGQRKPQAQLNLAVTSVGQGRSTGGLMLLLHKALKPSDVSSLGRTVLPKNQAETHMPYLPIREGITIAMEDFDTSQRWTFRYRFWPNNKSRMYLLENTRNFMRAHDLQEGDLLLLYRNPQGSYVVRGQKNPPKSGGINKTSEDAGQTSAEAPQGEEQLQKKQKM